MTVSKKDLVDACKDWGVYDTNNFTANMRDVAHGKVQVFLEEADGWRIPKAAEGFVASVVKKLAAPD
jgi:hypothetical protein